MSDFALEHEGLALPLPESARARTLLAWLAVNRGMHSRSRLAGLLRPDATEESARKSVRDAVWAIRQALGEAGKPALVTERERVGLAEDVETDFDAFRAALAAGRAEEAVGLAEGELLPGMDDDWIIAARDEVSSDVGEALRRLAETAEAEGDVEAAAQWARRRAALDPLAEEPVRELIRLLAAAGDRGRALKTYEELVGRLERELRTVPSEDTRALVARVRTGATGGAAGPAGPGPPSALGGSSNATVVPPPLAREVRYARSGELNIAYTTVGDGPLDLVFTPGFVSHLEVFWEESAAAGFLRRLASFARVILWDKREQGLSDRTGRAPTLEQGQDDLLAVMDAAGVERAAVVGVSEGGPMSILFAASHPDRVTGLALYGTHARVLEADDYPEGIPQEVVEATIDKLVDGWGGAPCLDLFAPSLMDDAQFRAWWSRALRSGTSAGSVRSVMELNFHIDVRAILPSVRAPTLVLHARDDRLLPLPLGRYLADNIPDARLVTVPIADHIPFAAAGDEIVDEIEAFLTGHRPAREPERILTTVVFTDVVGSTERAADLGDRRWRGLLQTYQALVREQTANHQGREISTTGDGSLASFDGPARAVRCAETILAEAEARDLPVRAGVHTGECEIVDGDLAGMAVHIGARIGEMAEAGEVLVSSTVRDLVVGSGLEFSERGESELRGVPDRWRLFALAG